MTTAEDVRGMLRQLAEGGRGLVDLLEAEADRLSPPTLDGSGSLPPDDPDPSPTPAVGFIVSLPYGLELAPGAQLWVRCETWGALGVDSRPSPSASWFPLADAPVVVAP